MATRERDFNEGDKCFLFLNLKIDPSLFHQLPIELAPGVSLALTPQHALACAAGKLANTEENIGMAAWVYPGYGLGMGIVNACIKIDSSVPLHLQDRYFWLMVEALYLVKPLFINIAGSFCYGNEDDGLLGRTPGRISHNSNVCVNTFFSHSNGENLLQFTGEDLTRAGIYFSRFVQVFNSRKSMPRPFFVLKAFFEATLWERSIYASTTFSKLFPLLDAFVGNPTHKHDNQVSKRLSSFLKEIPCLFAEQPLDQEAIRLRILSIWHLHRAPDIHGYLKELDIPSGDDSNRPPVDRSELKDLFDLMEFARLSIIKMLNLSEEDFQEYCQIPIPRRRYDSNKEKSDADNFRKAAAEKFFDQRGCENPVDMISYSDLIEYSYEDAESPKEAGAVV